MKYTLLAFLLVTSIVHAALPATAVRTTDIHDICTTKTSTIRDVSEATKKLVYKNAGITYGDRTLCSVGYEVDHKISLQLGGTNDISNLQLQAYCTKAQLAPKFPKSVLYDARAKDLAENVGHRDICSGKATPFIVQERIYNWKN
jgi:hypothetical protein